MLTNQRLDFANDERNLQSIVPAPERMPATE